MIGDRFGRLTVLATERRNRNLWCLAKCECGTTKWIRASSLTAGYSISCGCYARERIARANYRHGETTHTTASPEWRTWRSMRQRCSDPGHKAFASYGARGIRVCDRWDGPDGFRNFLEDMGRRPPGMSLDRIDNSRGYEPGNCRWATASQQAINRRERRRLADGRFAPNDSGDREPDFVGPISSPEMIARSDGDR